MVSQTDPKNAMKSQRRTVTINSPKQPPRRVSSNPAAKYGGFQKTRKSLHHRVNAGAVVSETDPRNALKPQRRTVTINSPKQPPRRNLQSYWPHRIQKHDGPQKARRGLHHRVNARGGVVLQTDPRKALKPQWRTGTINSPKQPPRRGGFPARA